VLFFLGDEPSLPLFFAGNTRMPQMMAGTPSTNVMFVTLLTSEFVNTSCPLPPLRPRMNAKIRLPRPEQ